MTSTPPEAEAVDVIDELTESGLTRAMVVMAHPDDNEFVCGGTVAYLTKRGWGVHIVVTTSGNKGTKDIEMTPQRLAATRESEQCRAATILGADEPVFFGFPDGYIENTNELRGLIVRQLRIYRPDLVITWDGFRPGFNHRDHRRTGRATYDAIYPAGDDHLYYPRDKDEGLEPYRPRVLLLAGTNEPDYQVDISDVLRTKVRAIMAHQSQMGGRDEDAMVERFRSRALEEARQRAVRESREFEPELEAQELLLWESFRLVRFG
jgi:LmbE family N-acetylglucosaminyl deacetylase